MMRFFSSSAIVVSFAALATSASAQSTTQTAFLQFTFRDSVRGTVVRPETVLVDNKVVFNTIDEAGRMTVPVPAGDRRILIKAHGYDDMDTRQTALADHTPNNVVLLDPSDEPEQLRPENLGEGMPADGTLIAGFITDSSTGKPLADADIELIGKDQKAKSDTDGFFKLPVPMPDGKQMPDDPRGVVYAQRNFRVNKGGYGFEEWMNVLVESGAPKIFQVEMVRGGGGNSLDEAAGRNNLQSGLFGITNVEPDDIATTFPKTQPGHEGHSH